MKNITKIACLLTLIAGPSVDAMGGLRGTATRFGGYLRRPQAPVNTFAFGRAMPHNQTGAQQQTWWQRFKDSLAGRNYPYAYPQYARDIAATRGALGSNTAAILTTLGLGGMGAYTLQQYRNAQEQEAQRVETFRQKQLQRYRTTFNEFE